MGALRTANETMDVEMERHAADAPAPAAAAPHRPSPTVQESELRVLSSELHAEILRRWPAYYPQQSGEKAPSLALTPRHCGFSVIFKGQLEFPVAAERKAFMIKIRREHKHGSFLSRDLSERTLALIRAEYAEHIKAYRFFADNRDGLSVVRPLDFIEPYNALVVEHAAGRDLSELVKEGSPLAASSVQQCGSWWRLFHHQLHQAQYRSWDPDILEPGLERRLTQLRTVGAPTDTLDALADDIRSAARRVTPSPVPVSLFHGDCKLRHVWASPSGIQVLDFGNAKVGDSWIDPAALVVELSLYSLWTRHLDAAAKAAEIRTLVRAYFDGPPPPAFSLYVVDCLLKKWHRRLRSWGPGAGLTRLRKSLQLARLDKPLERLYIDRWFTAHVRAWLAVADGQPPAWLRQVVE